MTSKAPMILKINCRTLWKLSSPMLHEPSMRNTTSALAPLHTEAEKQAIQIQRHSSSLKLLHKDPHKSCAFQLESDIQGGKKSSTNKVIDTRCCNYSFNRSSFYVKTNKSGRTFDDRKGWDLIALFLRRKLSIFYKIMFAWCTAA